MNALLSVPTRVLFDAGKGGAGKPSAACATAIGPAGARAAFEPWHAGVLADDPVGA